MKLGASAIANARLGASAVAKMYLGTDLVWTPPAAGGNVLRLPSSGNSYAKFAASTGYNASDVDVRIGLPRIGVWPPTGFGMISRATVGTPWALQPLSTRAFRLWWTTASAVEKFIQTSVLSPSLTGVSLRMVIDVDNGSGGTTATLYSKAGTAYTDLISNSGWTSLFSGSLSGFNSIKTDYNTGIEIGKSSYGQSCEMDVSGLVVMDSIGGTTPLAAVDFSGAPTGTAPITPTVGGTISLYGSASIVTP